MKLLIILIVQIFTSTLLAHTNGVSIQVYCETMPPFLNEVKLGAGSGYVMIDGLDVRKSANGVLKFKKSSNEFVYEVSNANLVLLAEGFGKPSTYRNDRRLLTVSGIYTSHNKRIFLTIVEGGSFTGKKILIDMNDRGYTGKGVGDHFGSYISDIIRLDCQQTYIKN